MDGPVLSSGGMRNAYSGIADYIHEMVKQYGRENLIVLGIKNDGKLMIDPIQSIYNERHGNSVEFGLLDHSLERDDMTNGSKGGTKLPHAAYDIADKHVILIDSVFQRGRTARAAMDSLWGYGRPASVRLAVVLKRMGQEMPIHPDYVFLDDSETGTRTLLVPDSLDAKIEVMENGTHALMLRERA